MDDGSPVKLERSEPTFETTSVFQNSDEGSSARSALVRAAATSFSSSSQSGEKSSSSSSVSSSSVSSPSSYNTSISSPSSQSSMHTPPGYKVWLSRPLYRHYRIGDKAVLRRKNRYMYDSRITNIEYGMMNKGEIVKAAQLSWFGKESTVHNFPQVGKGGKAY